MPQQNGSGYHFLFGQYFMSIAKYMAQFTSFRTERSVVGSTTEVPEKLRVIYGTPSAAFRRIYQSDASKTGAVAANAPQVNGKPNLPVFNFFCVDFRRDFTAENGFVRLMGNKDNIWRDDTAKTNAIMKAPQQWDLVLGCSIWTDTYKTRDDMMGKILLSFNAGDLYIPYQPDPVRFPDEVSWVYIRMDESVSDETEIENMPEKETKDIIRTNFSWKMRAVLPYPIDMAPYIENIQINEYVKSRTDTEATLVNDGYHIHVLDDDPFSFELIAPPTLQTPVDPAI